MSVTIDFNEPKPNDSLPFTVKEWVIGRIKYTLFYDKNGYLWLNQSNTHYFNPHCAELDPKPLAALLNLPLILPIINPKIGEF